jgi:hypothetical protein
VARCISVTVAVGCELRYLCPADREEIQPPGGPSCDQEMAFGEDCLADIAMLRSRRELAGQVAAGADTLNINPQSHQAGRRKGCERLGATGRACV